MTLSETLNNPIWQDHKIGDTYCLVHSNGTKDPGWKIAYYPIFTDGKTGKPYDEPRALIERPALFNGEKGIDFRETPIRFLQKIRP